ncbi:putative cold shock domain-containing protein 3-like [Capsicum annuum]|nr:putative cold shock domain-containing protein 3-like [Capsicum annuum]
MDEEMSISARRMSMRTRKIAPKMAAALASSDNRIQWAMLARLNALESDNAVVEPQLLDDDDDDEASLDDEDQEDLYGSVPFVSSDYNYKLFTSIHFILISVFHKKYPKGTKRKTRQAKALENKRAPKSFFELLNECGMRFCSIKCQIIHNDTRCLKFVA